MKYHIQVFLSVMLFALSFVWSKQALDFMTPAILITLRVTIAALLVTFFTLTTKKLQRLATKDALFLIVLALAEPVGYFLFENSGLTLVSPTLACLMIGLVPVLTPFAAHFINGEKISKYSYIGLFVSFFGVVIVVLSDGLDSIGGQLSGILLLCGAVVTAIIYMVMMQRISQKFNSFTIISYLNIFSLIFLIPIILLFDYDVVTSLSFDWDWIYPVLMLGVLCSSLAFILNTNAIRVLGVTKTSLYINLMPGITAFFSSILLGEALPAIKVVGILVTIVGLFIANRAPKSSLE